jgi:hypothetical protein
MLIVYLMLRHARMPQHSCIHPSTHPSIPPPLHPSIHLSIYADKEREERRKEHARKQKAKIEEYQMKELMDLGIDPKSLLSS